MILSHDELVQLTHRTKSTAQCRALDLLGIQYRCRQDGSPVVLAAAVNAALGGPALMAPARPAVRLGK